MTAYSESLVDLSPLGADAPAAVADPAAAASTVAVRLVDERLLCGEGIVYDDRTATLLYVDIDGRTFQTLELKHRPGTARHTAYHLPKRMGSFGLLEQQAATADALPLLCAWEDGFQLYDVAAGRALSAPSRGPDVNPFKRGSRLNDGRTDPDGTRYVCGGYYGGDDAGVPPDLTMQLFKVEQVSEEEEEEDGGSGRALVHAPILDGIRCTNSLCWTPDGTRMYFADSFRRAIVTYAYDRGTGALSDPQPLRTQPGGGVPDGSCVDAEGYLWNAVYDPSPGASTGAVHRLHPETGEVVYTVEVPDGSTQVTCCCFGGDRLDMLFITTAAHNQQDRQPHAGALYAARVPFTGVPEKRLRFQF